MEKISFEKASQISGGNNFVYGLCSAAGVATIVAATNFWNPVGWVAGAIAVADIGCVAYGIADNW